MFSVGLNQVGNQNDHNPQDGEDGHSVCLAQSLDDGRRSECVGHDRVRFENRIKFGKDKDTIEYAVGIHNREQQDQNGQRAQVGDDDVADLLPARSTIDRSRLDLILSREKFDVITLEPLLPYTQGAVHFYSREFYELARSRLSEGGTFCQWIPVHALPVRDYRMLVKTFFKVFPEGDLYFFEQSSLLLARKGGEAPLAEDYARRRSIGIEEAERWLSPILGYTPKRKQPVS